MVRQSSLPAHSSVFRGIGIDTTNLVSLHMTIRMTLGVGEVKPECPAGGDGVLIDELLGILKLGRLRVKFWKKFVFFVA